MVKVCVNDRGYVGIAIKALHDTNLSSESVLCVIVSLIAILEN